MVVIDDETILACVFETALFVRCLQCTSREQMSRLVESMWDRFTYRTCCLVMDGSRVIEHVRGGPAL